LGGTKSPTGEATVQLLEGKKSDPAGKTGAAESTRNAMQGNVSVTKSQKAEGNKGQ